MIVAVQNKNKTVVLRLFKYVSKPDLLQEGAVKYFDQKKARRKDCLFAFGACFVVLLLRSQILFSPISSPFDQCILK